MWSAKLWGLVCFLGAADACWWAGPDSWGVWGSCSTACGGGTRERRRSNCLAGWESDTGNCNEICYNGGTFFHKCHCEPWRSGRCCEVCEEVSIDHCKPNMQECGGDPDAVRCTDCDHLYKPAGWGKGCKRKLCSDGNGGCDHGCTYVQGETTCTCREGFQLQYDHYSCREINECSTGAAPCTQVCTNVQGSYRCSCDPGFSLDTDGYTCSYIDQCLNGKHSCEHLCLNKLDTFECDCYNGFTLDADNRTCNDINECLINNGECDQMCTNEPGNYHCHCHPGYDLSSDNKCKDMDECTEEKARCTHTCTNTPGSYACHCRQGYQLGPDGFTCSDINDCINITCMNDGICIDNVNSYTCSCKKGYLGEHCENDVDECEGRMMGGCEDECINTDGSYRCSCFEDRTLDDDKHSCSGGNETFMPTVFERESIHRELLPRGCHKIMLSLCSHGEQCELLLSSTESWYKLASNSSITFTHGIVSLELNDISLPLSITGITIQKTEQDLPLLTESVIYDNTGGIKIRGEISQQKCLSIDITPRDVQDFIKANSFYRTFFSQLDRMLPDWFSITNNGPELFELSDLKADIIGGSVVDKTICHEAPVASDRLYTMLIFNHNVNISFYGVEVTLPKSPTGTQYCILIDINTDLGGTIFILLPQEVRDILNTIPLFANLNDKYNLRLQPRGIGLSLKTEINAPTQPKSLWNGDHIFNYHVQASVNFWIGGDAEMFQSIFRAKGQADIYLSVPSPSQLLSSVLDNEWDIQISAHMDSAFIIQVFGRTYYLNFGDAVLNGYSSVGGEARRSWCGPTGNPPGVFVSISATVSPFIGIPILENFLMYLDSQVYAFIAFNAEKRVFKEISSDISNGIYDLNSRVSSLISLARETSNMYSNVLPVESNISLARIVQIGLTLEQKCTEILGSLPETNVTTLVTQVSALWEVKKMLETSVETFIDTVEFDTMGANGQLEMLLKSELKILEKHVTSTMTQIFDDIFNLASTMDGFGLKFQGELHIFGIKFVGADIELVYSVDKLGECSKYAEMFETFKGEEAIRVRLGLLPKPIRISRYISIDGVSATLAISTNNPEHVVIQTEALFSSFLGMTVSASITISPRKILFRLEGRLWDSFLAELQCFAYHNDSWDSLVIHVDGRLLAKGENDLSFDGTYLDGLRKLFKKVADDAINRIEAAQGLFRNMQAILTKAQRWLDAKQEDVRNANKHFDEAVNALDRANENLEDAKVTFNQAKESLDAAQRKVDNICQIKHCRKICAPGLSCRICHKKILFVNVPYPCCHFSSCMFSFPDPICEVANLGCRAIRGLAYAALEAAKIFVHTPIIALDIAKTLVSAAQIVVDKSRIVLNIAIGAIDLAEYGLEAAKHGLETASVALEVVKLLLKGSIKVVDFIIKEGIQRVIDVKDCQFHVSVGRSNPHVFNVSCQINPFMLGWVEVGIRINFKDSYRSLWNAAKGTVDTLVQHTSNADTRRIKRDLKATVVGKVHKLMRQTRDLDSEDIERKHDEMIDAVINTPGMRNSSATTDYETRVNIFAEKCSSYTFISIFMIQANDVLKEMVTETANMFDHLHSQSEKHVSIIDHLRENMSLDGIDINTTAAMRDFNITTEQSVTELNKTKANITNDPVLSQILSVLEMSMTQMEEQQKTIDNVQVVSWWIDAMDNVTRTHYDNTTCVSFIDCMHYSITTLYSLHDEEHHANVSICLDAISAWEDIFLNLTVNETHTIQSVRDLSVELQNQTHILDESIVFCSIAPTFTSQPTNATVEQGTTIRINCEGTGNPEPTTWWYKGDELLENETDSVLSIRNATKNDTSMYSCVVGNIVANLTSQVVLVFVNEDRVLPSEEVNTSQDTRVTVVVLVSSCLFVVVFSVVVFIGWKRYKRVKYRQMDQTGSEVSLNIIGPYPAPTKPAFDSTQ